MTNIGKPYEGKPHVRFDEEGQNYLPFTLERMKCDLPTHNEGKKGDRIE